MELGEVLTGSALEHGTDGKQDPCSCSCISRAVGSKVLAGCSESGSLSVREDVESQDPWKGILVCFSGFQK